MGVGVDVGRDAQVDVGLQVDMSMGMHTARLSVPWPHGHGHGHAYREVERAMAPGRWQIEQHPRRLLTKEVRSLALGPLLREHKQHEHTLKTV